MQIHNAVITGSFSYNGADLSNVTSSNQSSASLSTRVTQIEQVYATTGSNSFRATQSITGSLTVTGQIIAQTLNVQQVTSSIIYSSGSNNFGCDLNSRQTFTGSVNITGSLIVNTSGTEFQVTSTGVNFGNALTDTHNISGSLRITGSGNHFIMGCNLGIGTATPLYKLHIEDTSPRIHIRAIGSGGDAGIFMKASSSFAGGWTVKDDGSRNFWIYSDYANCTRLLIDSIGSVGIGVTPTSGWGSNTKVVQIGSGSLYNDSFNNTLIATNAYFNGSNNIHIATGPALRYFQELSAGDHYFQVAPSRTGGASVAYTSSLFIKNNGFIGVNTESPSVRFHVVGGNEVGIRSTVGGTFSAIQFSGDNNVTSGSINAYNGVVVIGRTTGPGTGVLPDVAINSTSGNVGIGITNPAVAFNVSDCNHGIGIAYRGSSALPSIAGLFTDTGVSGGTGYGDLLVKARTDFGGFYGVNFYTAASDNTPVLRMRVQSDGVLSLLSGQLKFPATQNPSSDVNTLDDYEEGTINITTLTDGSATLTQFTDNRTLSYTKIGNRVYVNGNIYNQSISGTWSNPLRIPLPFTAASGDGRTRSYGAAALYNWGSTSDNIYLIEAGATYATLVSAGNGGSWGTITTSSGFTAVVNFFYIAS